MTTTVLIIGGGKVGSHLASLLAQQSYRVRVIEWRRPAVEKLAGELPAEMLITGSGTDPNVLEGAGVRQCQVLAAVTGNDETNLVACSLARFEFGVPRIIARVNNPKNAWLFTAEMGVDAALDQADLMAHMIAEEMSLGDMMTLLKLRRGQFSLVEEKVDPTAAVVGKPLRELPLPRESYIAAIIRKGELLIPHGDVILQAADEILAIVHSSQINNLAQVLSQGTWPPA